VLTHGSAGQQHAKLTTLDLADRSEFVITSEDLGVGKPDPIAFLTACDRLGLPAREVVHVGDAPNLDVTAARAAGLHAVLIDRENKYQRGSRHCGLYETSRRVRGDLAGGLATCG
jgi:putative hydrolase of the HAD superfamily